MISLEALKEHVTYYPRRGYFLRANGRDLPTGQVTVLGKKYTDYKLAWFYMTGQWCNKIRFRDGDRHNITWANLTDKPLEKRSRFLRRKEPDPISFYIWKTTEGQYAIIQYIGRKEIDLGDYPTYDEANVVLQALLG